jgi:hypothetical protein
MNTFRVPAFSLSHPLTLRSRNLSFRHIDCYDPGHASKSLAPVLLKTGRASVFGCSVFGADGNQGGPGHAPRLLCPVAITGKVSVLFFFRVAATAPGWW